MSDATDNDFEDEEDSQSETECKELACIHTWASYKCMHACPTYLQCCFISPALRL